MDRQQQHIQLARTSRGAPAANVTPPMQPQHDGARLTSMCTFLHLAVYKGLMVEVMAQLPEQHAAATDSQATGNNNSSRLLFSSISPFFFRRIAHTETTQISFLLLITTPRRTQYQKAVVVPPKILSATPKSSCAISAGVSPAGKEFTHFNSLPSNNLHRNDLTTQIQRFHVWTPFLEIHATADNLVTYPGFVLMFGLF